MSNLKRTLIITFVFTLIALFSFAQESLLFSDNPRVIKGHRTTVNDLELSQDGKLLYSCGGNNQIIVFNTATGEILRSSVKSETPINEISLSNDGELLAYAAFNSNKVTICKASTLETVIEIDGFNMIDDICFSPVNNVLTIVGLSNADKQIINSYDVSTGELSVKYFEQKDKAFPTTAEYSKDGKRIACGVSNYNQGIKIWDANDGLLLREIKHNGDINDVEFSPDGKYIAGGSGDNNVYIWDIETGKIVHTLIGLNDMVYTINYSPDGNYIAGAGFDYTCTFKTWSTKTGELQQTIGGKGPQIPSVRFTPDGQSILVAYRTYGDLFEVATINVYSTDKAILESIWYKVSSEKSKLIIEFPETTDEVVSSDKYYEYYDYILKQAGCVFQVRATKYLYDIDDSKRKSTIEKKASSFAQGKTELVRTNYNYKSYTGIESRGFKSNRRYHQKTIFIDNVLYQIVYIDFEKEENIKEIRFFDSFDVK